MPNVLLAITPQGLKEALQLAASTGSPVWCGSDAVSESEFESLVGKSVTRFIYPLKDEPADVIDDALSAIEEHHPGAIIWVESQKSKA